MWKNHNNSLIVITITSASHLGGYSKMHKNTAKSVALIAIALMVVGGLVGAAYGQVQGTSKESFSFIVLGNGQIPASGINVQLENELGQVLASNISNPSVSFTAYPGNYVINIPSQYVSGDVYNSSHYFVNLSQNGNLYSSGVKFTEANVSFTKSNANLLVTVTGASKIYSVYLTLSNSLILNATLTNASNPSSPYTVSTVSGVQTLNVRYYYGSPAVYSARITVSPGSHNMTVNVTSTGSVAGSVTSTSGLPVSNVEISIYQDGQLLGYDRFSNGYYFVTLPAGSYNLVVTAPGYLPVSEPVTVGTTPEYLSVSLRPSNLIQSEVFTLGSTFQNFTVSSSITLTNSTVLFTLPYSDSGSLYNQMKLLGLSRGDLWQIMNYSIPLTSVNTLIFNNYSYNLQSFSSSLSVSSASGVLFYFNFTALYSQSLVKLQNVSTLQVYASRNTVTTSSIDYVYKVGIPSPYQRANIIGSNVANVSGYSGVVTISNSTFNGFINFTIEKQENPTLDLSNINAYWPGHFESTIMNSSAENFTLVVPSGKMVSINASQVPYDPVLQTDNYAQMAFSWNLGNGTILSGYNITEAFSAGSHAVTLKVTSASGTTNSTNFTIIGDSQNPEFNVRIIQNGTTVKNISTSSSASYVLWVNQSLTVYFNAIKSQDILPNGENTTLPLLINWNISGSKQTGFNASYSFTTPTFGSKVLYANVTVENAVGLNISITFTVHVNDTTPPVATFQITNAQGKVITSANEYQNITLNGSKSFAPNGGHIVSYHWGYYFSNGTVAKPNVDLKIYATSANNSTVTLSFIEYGTFKINLQVTDQSGHKDNATITIFVNAVRPEVEIMNVTYPSSYVEGSPASLKVELKNVGLMNASTYYLTVKINGKIVKNETLTNLATNQTSNATITFVPPNSGTYSMVVSVYAVHQPSFFNTNVQVTKAISVSQAAWKLPALVGGIVIAVGIVAFVYYDLTVRRKRPKEKKDQKKQLKI
jgi:hypothetical protein